MIAPSPQTEAELLFNQIAKIGLEDQQGLNALAFRAAKLVRKLPHDPTTRTAYATILISTGHLQDGKKELDVALGLSKNADLPTKTLIATLLCCTCQFHVSRNIFQYVLDNVREDLRHPEFAIVATNAAKDAVLSGDIDLLKSYAEVTQHKNAIVLYQLIRNLGLSETLSVHQAALNEVLGAYSAMNDVNPQYDPDGDSEGLIVKYFIPENLYGGRVMRKKIFEAVENAEKSIGQKPGYFSSIITVDISPMAIVGHLQAA